MEEILAWFAFLLCISPLFLIAGAVGFFLGARTKNPLNIFDQFANLVRFWLQTQQIDQASAERVLALLQKHGASIPVMPEPVPPASPSSPSPQPAPTVAAPSVAPPPAPAPALPIAEPSIAPPSLAPPAPMPSMPINAPQSVVPPTLALPIAEPSIAPPAPATSDSSPPTMPPPVAKPSFTDRVAPLFAALLSLGTRRMLLVIGAFLVIVSSLVLVIFNWNSFLPIVQVGILAALTGGLWGLGQWMQRRDAFATAGRNLSSVAALLAPIVAFSFTRPGLLNLDTDAALLAVSSLSLLLYAGGAWRTRRVFFSLAASAAAVGVLGSAFWQWDVAVRWQPVWSFGLWLAALVMAHRLAHSSAAALALGPRIVQWAGPPLSLLASISLFLAAPTATEAPTTMATLVLGALFGVSAAWLDRQPRWLWVTAIALPLAALIGVVLPDFGLNWINLSFAALVLIYLGLAMLLERRSPAYALPLLSPAPVLALVALGTALDRLAIGRSYPLLIGAGALAVALLERGRLLALQPRRSLAGSILLGLTILLLAGWAATFGESWSQRYLIALIVGGVALALDAVTLVGRISYAPAVCRWLGAALVAINATLATLEGPDTRIPALALATLLYGWQAFRARGSLWALASLTAGVGLTWATLHRLGWLTTFDHLLLTGMALAGGLAIGGSLLRHGAQRYWTLPALIWAGLLGSISSLWLLLALYQPSPVAVGAAVIGGASWMALGAIWRHWWLGYPAALTLAMAWLVAIADGFVRWEGGIGAFAVLAVPLSAGYGLLALALRRWSELDRPYAHFALGIALLIPLLAVPGVVDLGEWIAHPADVANLPLAVSGSTAILAAGALAYRRWRILSLSLAQLVITIGGTANWLFPRDELIVGWTALVAASVVGLGGLGMRRGPAIAVMRAIGRDSYVIGGIAALAALALIFTGVLSSLALPLLVVAVVIGVIATFEQSDIGAAASIAAFIGSLAGWIGLVTPAIPWQAAWLALAMAPVLLAGWAARRYALGAVWHWPTLWLPQIAAGVAVVYAGAELRPLVIALVNLGVVFVAAAARRRCSVYAYLAGAAFVSALLGQFLLWEWRVWSLYLIPVSVYLFAVAAGVRRFQRNPKLARLIDRSGILLMIVVTGWQTINVPFSSSTLAMAGPIESWVDIVRWLALDIGAIVASSAIWAGLSAYWRRWEAGYPAALGLANLWSLAVVTDILRWEGGWSEIGVLAVPLSLLLGLIGLGLRRWPAFDRPYAHFAVGVALLAPWPALFEQAVYAFLMAKPNSADVTNLPLAAAGTTIILIGGALLYRRWRMVSLCLAYAAITAASIANWQSPFNWQIIGWTLLVTASVIGLGGLALRRWPALPALLTVGRDSYGIGAVVALAALALLFDGNLSSLSLPLLICALTMALIAGNERSESGAVASVMALIGSIAGWLAQTGLSVPWQAAWLALALAPLVLAGWAARRFAFGAIWQRSTLWLPLAVGVVTTVVAAFELRALVVALVNAGVVFVTAIVRERRSEYAYLAGAAFVAASLGQFFVWDLREMQFYVIPVGVYLLALAQGVRYFQRRDQLARMIDTSAVALLLGATFLQAAGSPSNIGYILLVGGESLLVAAYGALARLRVPFIGGIASFVAGVLWLAANAARMLNQWLLLGGLGLLMLLAYVILERHQELLRRAGQDWAARLQQWR
ncbi:SCO7613 C-terminal domain-containing membrane protein [Chloroflexus sp.]|uniref:SCO7613 C-terminal domain-containing membrane protein n=1 Tax=Chloroflexus sp. TaxID=1904827 RepID=UPI002ACD6769|nr:hypothetical protein [Chloroflexus sp.]